MCQIKPKHGYCEECKVWTGGRSSAKGLCERHPPSIPKPEDDMEYNKGVEYIHPTTSRHQSCWDYIPKGE
jgi:hypothetical protein